MSAENVVQVTDANFEEEVTKSKVPVLADFGAEWCMPCRMIGPIVEELAGDYAGRLKVAKVNTDDARQTAQKFGISAIPTLLLIKDGKVVKKYVGLRSKKDLAEGIDGALK
jgi:thioredoxin 1